MYGWDYWTYYNQPEHFLKTVIEKYKIEATKERAEIAKQKQQSTQNRPRGRN